MNAENYNSQLQNTQAELFLRISQNMLKINDPSEFFRYALKDIGESTGASRVFIFEYIDRLWYEKYVWACEGIGSVQHLLQGVSLDFILNAGKGKEDFFQGNTKIITDMEKEFDDSAREFLRHTQMLSAIAVPFFIKGKMRGFFGANICAMDSPTPASKEAAAAWVLEYTDTMQSLGHLLNAAGEHYHAQQLLQKEDVRAQNILDVLPVPFYVINPRNHKIILQNKAFRDFVGDERLALNTCYKTLYNFDAPCDFCGVSKVCLHGEANIRSHHNDLLDLDFMVFENCVSWGKIKNAHAVTFFDITDSLKLEKEKILTRESVKAKARFLANMSHELRTPVNGIVGMTQLAEKNNFNALVAGYLEKIKISSKKLLSVVNNILDFSKIEAGKMDIETTVFDIQNTFERFVFDFIKQANAKNVEAIVDIDKSTPKTLKGDPLRLLQIIKNLADNAIKFTDKGHVSLKISCDILPDNTNCNMHIEVGDTGIGICETQMGSLFDLFYLGDASFSRQYGGTGIGLPVVKGLCSLMGGEISVQSELGKGSVFTCTLPFVLSGENDFIIDERHLDEIGENPLSDISIAGTRVLLAEDNEINVIIALEALQSFGCSVDIAADGIQVLEMVKEKEFDIVLMDMEMPRMSGFEATEKIRQDPENDALPIIGMSAHSVDDMKKINKRMGLNGMQDYISKPFEAHDLQKIIYSYARNFHK